MKFLPLLAAIYAGSLAAALPLSVAEPDSNVDLAKRGFLSAVQQGTLALARKPETGTTRLGNAKDAWGNNRNGYEGAKAYQAKQSVQNAEKAARLKKQMKQASTPEEKTKYRQQAKAAQDKAFKYSNQLEGPQGPLKEAMQKMVQGGLPRRPVPGGRD